MLGETAIFFPAGIGRVRELPERERRKMAEKDMLEKKLEDHNDVFADIWNTLLFGKKVLQESKLQSGPTESVYKNDEGKLQEQRRDTFKNYQDEASFIIAALGIENQSAYDRTMPVRVMGYDSSAYKAQIEQKSGRLYPVITIVLNFGNRKWSDVRSLRDLMGSIPKELEPYFQDYRIHVFDIAFLSDDMIDSFHSDFGVVARFFKNRRLGKTALADDTELDYPAEIAELLAVFTRDASYVDILPAVKAAKQRGECVTMCWVAQELIEKGEKQGKKQGEELMATLIQRLLADGRTEDVQRAASNEQYRKKLYQEYDLISQA